MCLLAGLAVRTVCVYDGVIVQCPDCPRAFTTSSNLTVHTRRAHSGEKPYACDVCKYSCTTSGDLARHKRSKAHMHAVAAVEDALSSTGICVMCVSFVIVLCGILCVHGNGMFVGDVGMCVVYE